MRSQRMNWLTTVLVTVALCASLAPATPAFAAGCSVSGRVFDSVTGAGLSAKVYLFKKITFWDPIGGRGQEWRAVAYTYASGATGEWTISKYTLSDLPEVIADAPDLPAGTYRIGFSPRVSGYHAEVYDNVIDYDIWAGKDVVLSAGQSVGGIDAGLSNGWGTVKGRLTDQDTGAPIADAIVDVQYWSPSLGDWANWTRCDTAADGTFVTDRFPSGEVRIRYYDRTGVHSEAFWPGTPREADAQVVAVGPGQAFDATVALGKRAILSGRVTEPDTGLALADIEVTAYRFDALRDCWSWDARTFTRADGTYDLRVNSGGTYRIEYRDWSGSYQVADDDVVRFYPGVTALEAASSVSLRGGEKLTALDATLTPGGSGRLVRIGGSSSAMRAIRLSREMYPSSPTTNVVLINPGDRAALAAAPALASCANAPILFTSSSRTATATTDEIARLGASRVFIVGSTTAVGTSVAANLAEKGLIVRRIRGADGAATTAAVLRKVKAITGERFGRRAIVVSSSRPVEIAAASALAYRLKAPIVLTGSSLSTSVKAALRDTGVRSAIVVGSTSSVSATAARQLGALHITTVRRAGTSYAATAQSLASYAVAKTWVSYETVGIAGSATSDAADTVLAGSYAGRRRGVLLLAAPSSVPAVTLTPLTANGAAVTQMRVVGTPLQIGSPVLVKLSQTLR